VSLLTDRETNKEPGARKTDVWGAGVEVGNGVKTGESSPAEFAPIGVGVAV